MTIRALCLSLLAVAAIAPPTARADDFICPEELSTKQIAVDTPLGWTANSNVVVKTGIEGIDLYAGSPETGADPIDPVKRTMKDGNYLTWTLDPGRKSPVWMTCAYHNTGVILMRKLPDTIKQCRYKDVDAYDHPSTLDCQ